MNPAKKNSASAATEATMFLYRRGSFVLFAATFATAFVMFFLVFCFYKIARTCLKCIKKGEEDENDNAKSKTTADIELSSFLCEQNDRKWSANEGFLDDASEYNTEMETISNVGRTEGDQVPCEEDEESPVKEDKEWQNTMMAIFENSETGKGNVETGCTRVNGDGSMDTRF